MYVTFFCYLMGTEAVSALLCFATYVVRLYRNSAGACWTTVPRIRKIYSVVAVVL